MSSSHLSGIFRLFKHRPPLAAVSMSLTAVQEPVPAVDGMKQRRTSRDDVTSSEETEKSEKSSEPKVISCIKDFDRGVSLATSSLQAGKLIALPTDTIYGICGLAQNSAAVRKIYKVKERDVCKPVAICVAKISDIYRWAHVNVSEALLEDLLPGPVTLVFERRFQLNTELNPGTSLIGIRIPRNSFMKRLTDECGEPLALTSANKSGQKSPLSIDEFVEIWECLDLVVDGGRLGEEDEAGVEERRSGSTVVDLSQQKHFRLIRNGSARKTTVDILLKHGLTETS